ASLLRFDQPGERLLLDIDQVRDIENLLKTRKVAARARSVNSSQDGDSSGDRGRQERGGAEVAEAIKARPAKIAQGEPDPCEGRSALTDPVRLPLVCGEGG